MKKKLEEIKSKKVDSSILHKLGLDDKTTNNTMYQVIKKFLEEIKSKKVESSILHKLGLDDKTINILKDTNNINNTTFTNAVGAYLWEFAPTKKEEYTTQGAKNFNNLLHNPNENNKKIFTPPEILINISKDIDYIEKDLTFDFNSVSFNLYKNGTHYELQNQDNSQFKLGSDFEIKINNTTHSINKYSWYYKDNNIIIDAINFQERDKEFFFRYISLPKTKPELKKLPQINGVIDGDTTTITKVTIKETINDTETGIPLKIYTYKDQYLIIDVDTKLSFVKFKELIHSTLLSIGLVNYIVYLDVSWILGSDKIEHSTIDSFNYEHLQETYTFEFNAIASGFESTITSEFFGNLINLLYKTEEYRRCTSILFQSTDYTLENKATIAVIAFEILANSIPKETLLKKEVLTNLKQEISKIIKNLSVDKDTENELLKKCNNFENKYSNAHRLQKVFIKEGIPLTEYEKKVFKLRNDLAHGRELEDVDQYFEVWCCSYKLCYILFFKKAGFKGSIINIPKVYGFNQDSEDKINLSTL